MNEDNKKEFYLPIRALIKEILIRDILIFIFMFIIINIQGWDNIFLLLFPLITFSFSMFFRIINTNKWRTKFEDSLIMYNPLGLEKGHANRLFFSALLQLILIFWIGAESLYHPHLVEDYYLYFSVLFFFLFSFGFFWIFIDLWKYSRLEIISDEKLNHNLKFRKFNHSFSDKNALSFLNMGIFKRIILIHFLTFIILNILNCVFTIMIVNNSVLGIPLNLPGTGSMGSESLKISEFFYVLIFVSPLLTVFSLILNYREINHINQEKLDNIIKTFPPNIQLKIIENLKGLSKRIKEQIEIE